jgi:hypothetical protein
LDRNDLGGFRYSRANQQTARPERLGIVPYWLMSSCLISALSLSEDAATCGDTTEVIAK